MWSLHFLWGADKNWCWPYKTLVMSPRQGHSSDLPLEIGHFQDVITADIDRCPPRQGQVWRSQQELIQNVWSSCRGFRKPRWQLVDPTNNGAMDSSWQNLMMSMISVVQMWNFHILIGIHFQQNFFFFLFFACPVLEYSTKPCSASFACDTFVVGLLLSLFGSLWLTVEGLFHWGYSSYTESTLLWHLPAFPLSPLPSPNPDPSFLLEIMSINGPCLAQAIWELL